MRNLKTQYLGLELESPIIAASSGLTDSVTKLKLLENAGAGAIVLKSLFEEEIIMEMDEESSKMNTIHLKFSETFEFMDSELKEDTIRKYLRFIKEAKEEIKIPIIASINCISSQKWVYLAKEIEKAGADALELNIFVMPTNEENSSDQNNSIYTEVVSILKEKLNIPISVKMSNYNSSLAHSICEMDKLGVDGVVLFNRSYNPDIDIETLQLSTGPILSDENDYKTSLRWTGIMSNKTKCSIASNTGIYTSETIIKQILAGADAIQIASVLYIQGAEYIDLLNKELDAWMSKHNYNSISDFKGKLSQGEIRNPSDFERVQFIKNIKSHM